MKKESTELFFQEVIKYFQYLVSDFNYNLISTDIENTDYYPDTVAIVRYLGNKVGLEVYWYLASSVISVALIEIIKEGDFPYKKRFWGKSSGEARAIKLHTLIDMAGKDDELMLKKPRSTKASDVKKRRTMIDEKLSNLVKNLADVLHEQAHDILAGDTSIFSQVQKYEEEILKKEYPY
ncbi:MAG: hypothetical protein Q8L64_02710 [bacterium]|nr:hypothetical protein [bacterium]